MSTTRSTMSYITSSNKNEIFKEHTIGIVKFSESEIIFKKTYPKNRNLSKSLDIPYPYVDEKIASNFEIFTEKPEENVKSILKSSFKTRSNQEIIKTKDCKKSVKFIDELDEEEIYENKNDKKLTLETNKLITDNTKDNFEYTQNNPEGNKIPLNSDKIIESEGGGENLKKITTSKQISNKSLAEIINVPSFRNYNIYRTNSKDLMKKIEREDISHAKCKCCVIF